MASNDAFDITLCNPKNLPNQGGQQGGDAAVIFLFTEPNAQNTLELTIKNKSGSGVKFDENNPISISMDLLLPPKVIGRMMMDCSGWKSEVDDSDGYIAGLIFSPSSPVTLPDKEKLTFTLTNIYFLPEDLKTAKPGLKNFTISYSAPKEREVTRAVLLTQWADQPHPLYRFQAAFAAVPESEKWNVKVNDAGRWIRKDVNTVFSNPLSDRVIRTRLAFCLINHDMSNDLRLTTGSEFKVSFLPGAGFSALAEGGELVQNVRITELSTEDWKIVQATDSAFPEWTLTPLRDLTLESDGGSYMFLIDAVLANANPEEDGNIPALTEMYVAYTKVPRRDGDGLYDDGYLAATIEKIAPTPSLP